MIKSYADAMQAVQNVFYPPTGSRGVGLYRAQKYSFGFDEYVKSHVEETVLILQVEHIDVLGDLDKILKIPQVDGIIIGPYDLSASLGIPGKFEDKKFKETVEKIEKKTLAAKKALGVTLFSPITN